MIAYDHLWGKWVSLGDARGGRQRFGELGVRRMRLEALQESPSSHLAAAQPRATLKTLHSLAKGRQRASQE